MLLNFFETYPIIILSASVVFGLFSFLSRKPSFNEKDLQEKYKKLESLSDEKAMINSKNDSLDELVKHGQMAEKESQEERDKNYGALDKISSEMEKLINEIAEIEHVKELANQKTLNKSKIKNLLSKKSMEEKLEPSEVLADMRRENAELESQNKELEKQLSELTGNVMTKKSELETKLSALQKEHDQLKEEKIILESKINEKNRKEKSAESYYEEIEEKDTKIQRLQDKINEYYHTNLIYELIIEKYADYIESNESKTVQDLKELVQPRNTHVQAILENIREKIPEYNAKTDLMKACEHAYSFIVHEIHSVPSPTTHFWMTIKDMMDTKTADYEDKAILLCSVMRALGAESSVIITELSDGSNKPFVLLYLEDTYLLDPNYEHDFFRFKGTREDIMQKYDLEGEKINRIIYEFSDKGYKETAELTEEKGEKQEF